MLLPEISLHLPPSSRHGGWIRQTMRILPPFATFLMVLGGAFSLLAQTTPPAGPKSVVRNGGFELARTRDDLWDGVDSSGYLAGEKGQVPALSTNGDIAATSMPISVNIADMNGDTLPDIVTMDVSGYLRIFFNSGTKTEPKFTVGEIGTIFLTRSPLKIVPEAHASFYLRTAPRIGLYDSMRSGKMDLYVGNYWGELFLVPNDGSGAKPEFRQPKDITKLLIPTAKDSTVRWGNIFAPTVWDWNKDGKDDLLIGEGSYSANNIHLLLNQGAGARPSFDENNRSVLAFGDGREQLTPAVVDYNGDGKMDLLVAERSGKLSLYLNDGTAWKPGVDIPFTSYVSSSAGAQLTFGGIFTVAVGDLNGDGLFDIVAGKTNGRIAVCYNTGTKTEPKFAAPVELKGVATTPPSKHPSSWDVDYGLDRGNYYGFVSIVTEAEDPDAHPPEGKACVKFGYQPSPNSVMSQPSAAQYTPAFEGFKNDEALLGEQQSKSELILANGPSNYCLLRIVDLQLKLNQTYTVSFRVKGSGVSDAQIIVGWRGLRKLTEDKKTVLDRNAVKVEKNEVQESGKLLTPFNPSGGWSEVKKEFSTNFKDKRLSDPATQLTATLQITFALQPMSGKIYFDDVQVIPK